MCHFWNDSCAIKYTNFKGAGTHTLIRTLPSSQKVSSCLLLNNSFPPKAGKTVLVSVTIE